MGEFNLIVMRHGQAESYSPDGDSGRRLTDQGRQDLAVGAAALAGLITIDAAIASPFARAQATAELVCAHHDVSIDTWAGLTPSSPPRATLDEILIRGRELPEGSTLAVFGHNPNVTALMGLLVAGRPDAYFNVRPGDAGVFVVPEAMPFRPIGAEGPVAILDGFYPLETLLSLSSSS